MSNIIIYSIILRAPLVSSFGSCELKDRGYLGVYVLYHTVPYEVTPKPCMIRRWGFKMRRFTFRPHTPPAFTIKNLRHPENSFLFSKYFFVFLSRRFAQRLPPKYHPSGDGVHDRPPTEATISTRTVRDMMAFSQGATGTGAT